MSKILVEDGPESNRFKVSLDEYQGTKLLNLRYWYKDKASGELKPSKRGIAITSRNYIAFKSVAANYDEQIMEHLNSGSNEKSANTEDLFKKREAQSKVKVVEKVSSVSFKNLKPSNKLYEIDYHGAAASVVFNANHPFVIANDLPSQNETELRPIIQLVVSLDLAHGANADESVASGEIILEQFLFDTFANCKKYSIL